MVSPLLILGGLVTGAAVVTAVRKKKKLQEVPEGLAKKLAPEAVAIAQEKMDAGIPPGEAVKIAASAVSSEIEKITSAGSYSSFAVTYWKAIGYVPNTRAVKAESFRSEVEANKAAERMRLSGLVDVSVKKSVAQ